VHGGTTKSDDWFHDQRYESSLEIISTCIIRFGVVLPLLCFLIEVVITPKLFHHFFAINTEFFGINLSKLGNGESPTKKG
jgi:hypothetical protein